MRHVHPAFHTDCRVRAQQSKRSQHIFALPERRIDGVDVFPFRIRGIEFCFQLARWSRADHFMRQVNAGALVQLEFVNHLLNAF